MKQRIGLRKFEKSDLEDLHLLLSDPAVSQMLPKGEPYSREESEAWYNGFQDHWSKNGFGVWVAERTSTKKFLGYCGLRVFPEFEEVEVLYSISKDHWGQGYASEAATASVDFGLNDLQLPKIIGLAKMNNSRSASVLQKAGLSFVKNTEVFGFFCRYYEIVKE